MTILVWRNSTACIHILHSQRKDNRILQWWSSLHAWTDHWLQSGTRGWTRLQGAGVGVCAFLLTSLGGSGSMLVAGCVGAMLGLITGGTLDCQSCVCPRALYFRRGGSSSWNAGSIRDAVCISRVRTALNHAEGAAEVRRWREARGTIWLPLVSQWLQGQHLKRYRMLQKLSRGVKWSGMIYVTYVHTCSDKGLDVTDPSQSERLESVLCLLW